MQQARADAAAEGIVASACRIFWEGHERAAWDGFHAARAAALQQDWAYGQAMAMWGARALRCVVKCAGMPVALAQFGVRSLLPGIRVALCSRGPVWSPLIDGAGRASLLEQILRGIPVPWPCIKLVSPAEEAAAQGGIVAMHRVMTGYSTVLIDLEQSREALRAALHPKWRNRLAVAERGGLRIERIGTRPGQYRWLLERECAQRTLRGYKGLPAAFVPAFQAARDEGSAAADSLLALRVVRGRDALAAMLFLRHGAAATYHLGWSDPEHRAPGASQLLLWTALSMLREAGVRSLDLGGVNTGRSAGVARFKLGTGGKLVTLAGTYW